MSQQNPDCPICRVLRFALHTRDDEVADLKRVIARTDAQPGGVLPEWAVRGENPFARLTLAGPVFEPRMEPFYRVSLEDRRLRCSADVFGLDAASWLSALEDLGTSGGGRDTPRSVQTVEGDFSVSWEYLDHYPTPRVGWRVKLANDWHDPNWSAEFWLETPLASLAGTIDRARAFFTRPPSSGDGGAGGRPPAEGR